MVKRNTRISVKNLYFYLLLFYAFGMDYLYLSIQHLDRIINSVFIGLTIFTYSAFKLLKSPKNIPTSLYVIYGVSYLVIIFSWIIQGSSSVIVDQILTFHNIKLMLLIPICFCNINENELNKVLYRFSIWILLYYFFIYKVYFTKATIEGGFYANYGMYFGFESMLFWLVILQHGFNKKKLLDFVLCVVFGLFIISFGSRSVILVMAGGFITYLFVYFASTSIYKKIGIIVGLFVLIVVIVYFYDAIVYLLIKMLDGYSNLGRTLWYLRNPSKTFEMDGRDILWKACLEEITRNPLSIKGVTGDRIYLVDTWGKIAYAHNFMLELLLEFGVIFGGMIVIFLIKIMTETLAIKDIEWKKAILPFMILSYITLFFSLTIWGCMWFWIYIVLLMRYRKNKLMKDQGKKPQYIETKNSV